MAKIITFASAKGGVGKTTGATSIAHGLALEREGKVANVLLVDFDPQGHDAIALGLDPEPGIFDFFVTGAPLGNLIRATNRPGLHLLPSNSRTRTAETVLRLESSLADLAVRMDALVAGYDYVVIDTPPSGLLQELAIRVADALIIPVRLEALGMDGVASTLQMAKQLQMRNAESGIRNARQATGFDADHAVEQSAIRNPKSAIVILPTMFDRRLKEHEYNDRQLREAYGGMVAQPVPARVAVAEAHALGRTVWEHDNPGLADVRAAYGQLLGWLTNFGL
jgi:cellulose biosynthesis protein BcsQ